jgi:hypothetical protein
MNDSFGEHPALRHEAGEDEQRRQPRPAMLGRCSKGQLIGADHNCRQQQGRGKDSQ